MVLIRINLKLIKCDFLLDFILFHFLKEIIKNVFLNGILFALLKKFWRYDPWKNFKNFKNLKKFKKKNAQKRSLSSAATWIAFLAWKTLNFGFFYFYESYSELNFLSKIINSESIGILSCKLWPKYETGAEDNTNSALSSIFSQNFKWGSTSNLSKLI